MWYYANQNIDVAKRDQENNQTKNKFQIWLNLWF